MTCSITGGLTVAHPPALLPGKPWGLRLLSDLHLGAANADLDLFGKELAAAQAQGDRILLLGDVFDMILHKDPKRFLPSVLHKRLRGSDDLVNRAVDWAFELLSPAVGQIDMIASGNHETSVVKHHSTDPTALLVQRLQTINPALVNGGYQGLLRYTSPGVKKPWVLFYWHGAGGGSGLGGSLGEFASKGSWVEGADASWYAHKHCKVVSQVEKVSCPASGHKPRVRQQWLLRTGGYLLPYSGQSQGHMARHGRRSNYSADSLHTPYGRGGLRIVLTGQGSSFFSTVEVSS